MPVIVQKQDTELKWSQIPWFVAEGQAACNLIHTGLGLVYDQILTRLKSPVSLYHLELLRDLR